MKPRALSRYKNLKHRGKTISATERNRRIQQSLLACGLLRRIQDEASIVSGVTTTKTQNSDESVRGTEFVENDASGVDNKPIEKGEIVIS